MSLADGGHRVLESNLGKVRVRPDGKVIVSRPDDEDCVCCLPPPPPPPDSCLPASWVTGDYSIYEPFAGTATFTATGITVCVGCFDNIPPSGYFDYDWQDYIGGDIDGTWTFAPGAGWNSGPGAGWNSGPFTGPLWQPYTLYSAPCDTLPHGEDLHGCDNCPYYFQEGFDTSHWEVTCLDAATKKYQCQGYYGQSLMFHAQATMVALGDGSARLTFVNTIHDCLRYNSDYDPVGWTAPCPKTLGTGGTVVITFEAPPP